MTKAKIAINGFGRIGRALLRILLEQDTYEIVAINDLSDINTLTHLFKYDSVHGRFNQQVNIEGDSLLVKDQRIKFLSCATPLQLPWKDLDVDVVIECTGKYKSLKKNGQHITAGAKKVIISAPSESDVKMVVLGINDEVLEDNDIIISNASCTTNCAAPLVKVLDDNWDIETAYITTIHSFTSDQKLHDAPHYDLRRARAASMSIIPTTTGAAKAVTKIFPHLENKMGGCGMRVPVANGSLTDLTCILSNSPSIDEVNSAFEKASKNGLNGILEYITDPIVSVDIIGNPHSCVFDSQLTSVIGNMVKVVGWYDNEIGYSSRLSDLIGKITQRKS
ncbi:MAG: type I glyceraldehyde-3-phosphate dehydrogenase [Flavobacteriales bacterium]|nr:type I glyceraldehyde-3-phosphate dehydrogenase [Flavobacteriales bacterium]